MFELFHYVSLIVLLIINDVLIIIDFIDNKNLIIKIILLCFIYVSLLYCIIDLNISFIIIVEALILLIFKVIMIMMLFYYHISHFFNLIICLNFRVFYSFILMKLMIIDILFNLIE